MKKLTTILLSVISLSASIHSSLAQAPLQEIEWDQADKAVNSSDVVLFALIDEFKPNDTSDIPNNYMPSEMLRFYLGGTATLAANDSRVSLYYNNCPDSPGRMKLSNLVAKAYLIHKNFGFADEVDGSFPKVFLFYRGKAVQHWSYKRSPGIELENQITATVRQLLK